MKKLFRISSLLLSSVSLLFFSASCGKQNSEYQGYIKADFVYISAPCGGKLEKLFVKKGEIVNKNKILFSLNKETQQTFMKSLLLFYEAATNLIIDMEKGARPELIDVLEGNMKKAQAYADESGAGYKQMEKLWKEKAVTGTDYDMVKYMHKGFLEYLAASKALLAYSKLGARPDRTKAAKAAAGAIRNMINYAEWLLSQTEQDAPCDAMVFDTLYREGEYVLPAHPVAVLLPPSNIKVRFFVPDAVLKEIKQGKKIFFKTSGGKEKITAFIDYISPLAEYTPPVIYSEKRAEKFVYMVEAAPLKDTAIDLHPGQPVTVSLQE